MGKPKKAKHNALSAEDPTKESAGTAGTPAPVEEKAAEPAAQSAALNSVEQVQPAQYRFDPERYQDYRMESSGWWSIEALTPRAIQTKRVWGAKVEAVSSARPALGYYLFDNHTKVWRSAPPPSHASKRVQIELDRSSYVGSGVKKPQKKCRQIVDTWAFPDSGAQVCLISPKLVRAIGGEDLVQRASLQIKDAGDHLLECSGCIFVVISKKCGTSGVISRTFQQAYVSQKVDDVVLSRESMETLKMVSDLDDRKPRASVRVIKSTVLNPYYAAPSSAVGQEAEEERHGSSFRERVSRLDYARAQYESTTARERHRSRGPLRKLHSTPTLTKGVQSTTTSPSEESAAESSEYMEYNESTIQGGQVTMDILAAHNEDHSECKVTLADLRPSKDPEHKCRGSLPLKNGLLTCGCWLRKRAPEALSHREVAGFDGMSNESLRQFIIQRYAASGFNNCRVQPLSMMFVDQPLRLFVDPTVKPVAINKAAIIPIHLKARVKADLD